MKIKDFLNALKGYIEYKKQERAQQLLFDIPRHFILKQIIFALDGPATELAKELEYKSFFWAPEMQLIRLAQWCLENISINPDNHISVDVYSTLLSKACDEIKEMMKNESDFITEIYDHFNLDYSRNL